MRFHLKDLDMGRDKTSSVKVIEDGEMTPTLAATSLYNMLNKTLDRSGAGTATISYTITPRGKEHKPLTRTNMFYSSDSISEKAVDEFYNVIDVLMNNRFINYEISDISVETEVTQDKKTAKLIDASASSTIVSPGDTDVYKRQNQGSVDLVVNDTYVHKATSNPTTYEAIVIIN